MENQIKRGDKVRVIDFRGATGFCKNGDVCTVVSVTPTGMISVTNDGTGEDFSMLQYRFERIEPDKKKNVVYRVCNDRNQIYFFSSRDKEEAIDHAKQLARSYSGTEYYIDEVEVKEVATRFATVVHPPQPEVKVTYA